MLWRVLFANVGVAAAKMVVGYVSGSIGIVSDGFHSLTDAASNVVGLVGVQAAKRPPDVDHPYGHRKYETVAASVILLFLLPVVVEVLRLAFGSLSGPAPPHQRGTTGILVMSVTVVINLFVIRYETREAKRLTSEVLLADATQTRADVWTSLAVITALFGSRAGLTLLDPLAAIVVAGFIGQAGYQIARTAMRILSDRVVFAESDVEQVVMSVPGVLGCHHIRSRGTADHVFLDLHVWLAPEMPLIHAHALSHAVKDRLMVRYPQIADAVIHIEPPPLE